MQLAELSWEQVEEHLETDDCIILPIGATEQHGRHLGLGTDYMIAEAIARQVGEQAGVLVAPTLAYGMSYLHLEFCGTVSLAPMTLILVLQDVFQSLYRHGFRRVLVINGHGGNQPALQSAAAVVQAEFPDLRVKSVQWWLDAQVGQIVEAAVGAQRGTHASNHETAFMHAIAPHAVHAARIARRDAPVVPSSDMDSPTQFRRKYPDGVMGLDPTRANAELGMRVLARAVQLAITELESL